MITLIGLHGFWWQGAMSVNAFHQNTQVSSGATNSPHMFMNINQEQLRNPERAGTYTSAYPSRATHEQIHPHPKGLIPHVYQHEYYLHLCVIFFFNTKKKYRHRAGPANANVLETLKCWAAIIFLTAFVVAQVPINIIMTTVAKYLQVITAKFTFGWGRDYQPLTVSPHNILPIDNIFTAVK